MTRITSWQWFLVLSFSVLAHLWLLSYGVWDHTPKPPTAETEVVIKLTDTPEEAREAAIDEARIESATTEVLEPETEALEAVDIEVPEVVESVEGIELVAVEETLALEAEVSDAIDALAVEVVEIVALAPEEPVAEEVAVAVTPVEVEVLDEYPAGQVEAVEVLPESTPVRVQRPVTRPVERVARAPGPPPSMTTQPALRSYLQAVQAVLHRNKRYPDASRRAGEQGLVVLQFVLGRFGQILTYEIENSSGHSSLDSEAVSLVRRVKFPSMPSELSETSIEFVVPLRFALN